MPVSFKHILLGTLLDFPTHAYDMIKKCFLDFTPANPKLNEGRLYSTLKTLDREGMVVRSLRPQQDMPDQRNSTAGWSRRRKKRATPNLISLTSILF